MGISNLGKSKKQKAELKSIVPVKEKKKDKSPKLAAVEEELKELKSTEKKIEHIENKFTQFVKTYDDSKCTTPQKKLLSFIKTKNWDLPSRRNKFLNLVKNSCKEELGMTDDETLQFFDTLRTEYLETQKESGTETITEKQEFTTDSAVTTKNEVGTSAMGETKQESVDVIKSNKMPTENKKLGRKAKKALKRKIEESNQLSTAESDVTKKLKIEKEKPLHTVGINVTADVNEIPVETENKKLGKNAKKRSKRKIGKLSELSTAENDVTKELKAESIKAEPGDVKKKPSHGVEVNGNNRDVKESVDVKESSNLKKNQKQKMRKLRKKKKLMGGAVDIS